MKFCGITYTNEELARSIQNRVSELMPGFEVKAAVFDASHQMGVAVKKDDWRAGLKRSLKCFELDESPFDWAEHVAAKMETDHEERGAA